MMPSRQTVMGGWLPSALVRAVRITGGDPAAMPAPASAESRFRFDIVDRRRPVDPHCPLVRNPGPSSVATIAADRERGEKALQTCCTATNFIQQ